MFPRPDTHSHTLTYSGNGWRCKMRDDILEESQIVENTGAIAKMAICFYTRLSLGHEADKLAEQCTLHSFRFVTTESVGISNIDAKTRWKKRKISNAITN